MERGTIVLIVSANSMHKGTYGYVYKLHESGRYGVAFPGGKKVTYTQKGILPVVCAVTPRGDVDYEIAVVARDKEMKEGPPSVVSVSQSIPQEQSGGARMVTNHGHGRCRQEERKINNTEEDALEMVIQALDGLRRTVEVLERRTGNATLQMTSAITHIGERISRVERDLNSINGVIMYPEDSGRTGLPVLSDDEGNSTVSMSNTSDH